MFRSYEVLIIKTLSLDDTLANEQLEIKNGKKRRIEATLPVSNTIANILVFWRLLTTDDDTNDKK